MTSIVRVRPRYRVRVAHYRAGDVFGPRELGSYELVWLLRGSAQWTVERPVADGSVHREVIALAPGTMALAQSGTVDSYEWDPRGPSAHAYVHFDLDPEPPPSERAGWPLARPMAEPLPGLCAYLLGLARLDDEASRARSDEIVALLVDLHVRGPFPSSDPTGIRSAHVRSVAEQLARHWAAGVRAVPLDDLAASASISPGHLAREFRSEFGISPARSLELIRLGRAAIAVQRTDAPLRRVAEEHGFSDPYHFSHRFSLVYGMPPGRFRRSDARIDPLGPIAAAGLLPLWNVLGDAGT